MSTLAVNTITNAAGGNTAQINGMTPTAQSLQGFRNRLINADMRIAQRGTAAVTFDTNATYILDRWTQNNSGGATITGQQSTTAPTGFVNSLLVTATSGGAPSAAQLRVVRQKIEGLNTSDLGWGTASAQTVTASFWVRSNVTGTFACYVTNAGYTRSQVQTFSISASNTWEYKTVVFAGDTSGTWATDTSTGVEFGFDVGSGSNFDATAGVWNAAFDTRTSGAVTLSSTTNNNIFITGVQLEAGSVATPFERVPYGTQLALCQRYFEKTFPVDVAPVNAAGQSSAEIFLSGSANGGGFGGNMYFGYPWKVTKRAAPTVTAFNTRDTVAGTWSTFDGTTRANTAPFFENANTNGVSGYIARGTLSIAAMTASAEL
jgi:hypothetical protein